MQGATWPDTSTVAGSRDSRSCNDDPMGEVNNPARDLMPEADAAVAMIGEWIRSRTS
jgi:hypothetical protein